MTAALGLTPSTGDTTTMQSQQRPPALAYLHRVDGPELEPWQALAVPADVEQALQIEEQARARIDQARARIDEVVDRFEALPGEVQAADHAYRRKVDVDAGRQPSAPPKRRDLDGERRSLRPCTPRWSSGTVPLAPPSPGSSGTPRPPGPTPSRLRSGRRTRPSLPPSLPTASAGSGTR